MAGSGWQFSVTVPSWTQASLEGDENVVVSTDMQPVQTGVDSGLSRAYCHSFLQFYRVEVKVLPPEADAAPRTRSVLRRFSHFTKLSQRVSFLQLLHVSESNSAERLQNIATPVQANSDCLPACTKLFSLVMTCS